MEPTLAELLTLETLRRQAGRTFFERGEEYAEIGAVGALQWDESSVRAGVQGTERYRVRLEAAGAKLVGTCSCPVGRDGFFCKHCVAVGLAWLSRSPDLDGPSAPTRSELHDRLAVLGADALAGLLVEHALDDERLHARLLALTAGTSAEAGPDFRQLAHAFDVAANPGGFVSWNEAYGFTQALESVIGAVEQQLGSGHGAEIVAFCEHALRSVERACEYVDDSGGGELGEVKERLEQLHLAACREARPDPCELAERLFRWELESEWETFFGAAERYADVLGEAGIARYRELAESAWQSEPELGPGSALGWSSRRYRLSRIMEDLARTEGNVDALVAVLARDRSSGYRYLLIAEALLEAERADDAALWAERGLAAFPEHPDSRLVDFVCDRYGESGRHEQAVRLAWETLEASPRLEAYKRLARVAGHASRWESWRERARAVLREAGRDRSELVAALLWEDDPEQAWHEAKEGDCRRDLWLALARRREREHPADALEIYRAQIEPAIRHSDNHTYFGAVEWLEKVQAIFTRLEQEGAFDALVRDIRQRHRAKRNLIKRLDERGWAQAAGARPAKRAVHS